MTTPTWSPDDDARIRALVAKAEAQGLTSDENNELVRLTRRELAYEAYIREVSE